MGAERRHARKVVVNRSEGFGERLLGTLLDRAHQMPPQLIAPLVAEEAAGIGGRDVSILLQDYGQKMLQPLPGRRLMAGEPPPPRRPPAPHALLAHTLGEGGRGGAVAGGLAPSSRAAAPAAP